MFMSAVPMAQLFLQAGAWLAWRILMGIKNRITCYSIQARVSQRSGICLEPHGLVTPLGQLLRQDTVGGDGRISMEPESVPAIIIVAASGTEPLLGVTTPESVGIMVDPTDKRLNRPPAIPHK